MDKDSCYELGFVEKSHGIEGGVVVKLDVDVPEEYTELESVFVEIRQKLVPFFIEHIRIGHKRSAVVKFEDVESRESAEELRGCKLFLPTDSLPPLEGNSFYYHEVVGYEVEDKTLGLLGPIASIYESPQQDLMAVTHKDCEILVPINDHIILSLDREAKRFQVDLPEGLVDIYLEG